ncbi:MAG: hypothetical protein MK135_12360, partial [Polyangiaceae bacterium]|nr:hypothetical protein [Polyangiaceae bacterium]
VPRETLPWQRVHGDYHLGQTLQTNDMPRIIDFEGEPSRSLNERRTKNSPLFDLAGMLRSFDYAAEHSIRSTGCHPERARAWSEDVCKSFLSGYDFLALGEAHSSSQGELKRQLQIYCLEKSLYEIIYEAEHRPDWLLVPISGALRLLEE